MIIKGFSFVVKLESQVVYVFFLCIRIASCLLSIYNDWIKKQKIKV